MDQKRMLSSNLGNPGSKVKKLLQTIVGWKEK